MCITFKIKSLRETDLDDNKYKIYANFPCVLPGKGRWERCSFHSCSAVFLRSQVWHAGWSHRAFRQQNVLGSVLRWRSMGQVTLEQAVTETLRTVLTSERPPSCPHHSVFAPWLCFPGSSLSSSLCPICSILSLSWQVKTTGFGTETSGWLIPGNSNASFMEEEAALWFVSFSCLFLDSRFAGYPNVVWLADPEELLCWRPINCHECDSRSKGTIFLSNIPLPSLFRVPSLWLVV